MAAHQPTVLTDVLTTEQLGRKVSVGEKDGRNVFRPL
jgi:acetyl-CoA C-acetyltransferase